jgi:hypothetical protein
MTKRAKRPPYSRERKAEALALARIAGAEVASDRTHIPVQSIRRWMDAAGVHPGAELPNERLEALRDLAEASVTADLVAGRIRGVQAMTVAGIARRHIAKPPPQPDPQTSVQEAIDELEAIMADVYPETDLHDILAILLAHERLSGTVTVGTDNPDPDVSGEAVIASWLETLDRLIKEHGSLKAAQEWQHAEDRRRLDEQLERNRINSERAIASSRQAMLDNETRSILAAAEMWLRESADA